MKLSKRLRANLDLGFQSKATKTHNFLRCVIQAASWMGIASPGISILCSKVPNNYNSKITHIGHGWSLGQWCRNSVLGGFKTQKKCVLARSGKSALKKNWVLASPENDDFTELEDSLSQNTLES